MYVGPDKEKAPILGSWKRIYIWLMLLNVIFAVLFYIFMRIYTY